MKHEYGALFEWYWQRKTAVLAEKMYLCHYTSYVDRSGTKPGGITRGLPKDSNKYLRIAINRVNFVFEQAIRHSP